MRRKYIIKWLGLVVWVLENKQESYLCHINSRWIIDEEENKLSCNKHRWCLTLSS